MSKMDERILAVFRNELFEDEHLAFQGLLTDEDEVARLMDKFNDFIEVRRGDAENDDTLKQPIPYVIIRRGESVFLYKRLGKGGETRLHDQLSIGVGGHMNKEYNYWDENLSINILRELEEELEIKTKHKFVIKPKPIGLINDDLNEVGRMHICILLIVDIPHEASVEVKETDTLEGYWVRIKDLKKSPLHEQLETWSQMAADIL